MIGRRRFLAAGFGGGMATVVGWTESASAATATTVVWRLNSNWGYPVAPKGQTRCTCRACHLHAANKVFVTRAAAISGRIHLCCVCQPFSVELFADDAAALFPTGGPSLDLRTGTNAADFAAALDRFAEPGVVPVPSPAPPVVITPAATLPAAAIPAATIPAAAVPTAAVLAPAPPGGVLPQTGVDGRTLLGSAAVLVGLGAVAVSASRTATPAEVDGSADDTRSD